MLRRKLAWVFLSACGGLLFFSCGGKEKKKETPAPGVKETPRVEAIRTERAPEMLAVAPASAFSSLDARIPPDAVLLIAVRDAGKFLSDFKTSALYQAIMDPALSEWRKQILGDVSDSGQGGNEFSLESGPWKDEFQKDMVIGVLMPDKGKSEKEGVFFITDQRGRETAHRIFMKEKILNYLQKPKNPILISQEEIEGIVVGTFGSPMDGLYNPGLYYFEKDGIFTYASTRGAVEKLVHQALKPEQAFRSNPSYQKALASIPPGHVGDPVVMYLDIAALVKRSRYTGEVQLGQGMEPKTKSVVFMSIFGLYTIQTLSGSTRIEDHAFRSAFCVKFSGPRQGMMDIFGESAAGGPEILNYLPEDAIFAGELRLRSGIEIWQKFLTTVQSNVTPERYMNFQKNIAKLQAQLGINLQDDIFTPLDGRIGYAVWGGPLLMSPTVAIFVGCKDQKRLLAAIGSMLGKTSPPSIGTGNYRDVSYSIYPLPGAMYKLSCAAVGDFVVITNQAAALEKCIDIFKDKKGGLASSAKFQRHAAKLPGKAAVFGYNEVEKLISPMVMAMRRRPETSGPGQTRPDFSVMIKYFFGNSVAVVCGTDSLTVESFGSFTGGLPLILAVTVRRQVAGFNEANIRSSISRAKSDQRSLANALEAYYVENNSYVSWATGDQGVNNFLPAGSAARARPTFRRPSAGGPRTLTTPLAYSEQLYPDPFAPDDGAVHSYYCDGGGWILLSAGPDGDYNIDPQKLYNSSVPQPSTELLSKSYDPTNGTISDGDIFRVKM